MTSMTDGLVADTAKGGDVMDIDFTGRQMDVTPDLQLYTHQHLRKLRRAVPSCTSS
jgi:hypothetical protein